MPRQRKTIFDDLALLPWWANVILAAVVFLAFRYWIPSIEFQNPILKGIAIALPKLAPAIAGILCIVAAISAFNGWRKGELLERQTGIGTLRAIGWREFEELVGGAYRRQGYTRADRLERLREKKKKHARPAAPGPCGRVHNDRARYTYGKVMTKQLSLVWSPPFPIRDSCRTNFPIGL